MVRLVFHPEASDQALVILLSHGIPASFGHRGVGGDEILVPARHVRRARRLTRRV